MSSRVTDSCVNSDARLRHRPTPSERWFRSELLKWGKENSRPFPWRNRIPFWKAVVVEVLLQRTGADRVAPAFRLLSERFPTARAFSEATVDDLDTILAPLGLRKRGATLLELARLLRRHGKLPRDVAGLSSIHGIGPYTVSAALSLHGQRRATIVDTNVARVVCRFYGRKVPKIPDRDDWLRARIEALTPDECFREFNYALLDLGAAICRSRRTHCGICPLQSHCLSADAFVDQADAPERSESSKLAVSRRGTPWRAPPTQIGPA